jgi:hypothetical protein
MVHLKPAHLFKTNSLSIARSVALLLFVAAAAFSAVAQSTNDNPPDSPQDSPPVVHLPGSHPPSGGAGSSSDVYLSGSSGLSSNVDPRAREEAAKLAELMGIRQKLEEKFPTMMQGAVAAMRRNYPNVDPRFAAEWERRLRAQLNADDFVDIFVRVYAEHFTADELEEMIQAVRARQDSKPVTLSPQLVEKIRANAIDIQSEILGAFTEAGAREGGEIGKEIGQEHPDWVRKVDPAATAATK